MSGLINSAGSRSGVIGTTELDYEFGTWSPTDLDGSSSHTPTNQNGYYVKIGHQVMVKGWINGFANISSANTFTIGNLPFTSGATQLGAAGAGTASEHNFGSGMVVFVNSSNTSLYFFNTVTGDAGNTPLKFSNFYSTGANVYFEAQYQTGY